MTDGPAVQRHQLPHNGEPDAQAAFGSGERAFTLDEEIENVGQQVARNADAGIRYAHHGPIAVALLLRA